MAVWDQITAGLVDYGPKVLLAGAVLWAGLWLIGRIAVVFDGRAQKRNMDPSLRPFLRTVMTVGLKIMLVISVASMIGIAMTSFVAVLGAAGLAIGLALQGSLANFAGGVLILAFRPFKVGDSIEALGYIGKVHEIQVFSTVLKTGDNKTIVIPNGALSNSSLTNFSTEPLRRVDVRFAVSRAEDSQKVQAAVAKALETTPNVASEPAPYCRIGELAGGTANYDVRVWTKGDIYADVQVDLIESVKRAFETQGIQLPGASMEVKLTRTPELDRLGFPALPATQVDRSA